MTTRTTAAMAAVALLAWPQAVAACDLSKLTGRWLVQVIETETVYPEDRDYTEETSHIVCDLRVTRKDAQPGEALAIATCSTGPYSSSAGEPPERFVLERHPGQARCEWSLSSMLDAYGEPINGTGDGVIKLTLNRAGSHFLGNGNLPLGIGGERLPERSGDNFRTTLIGMKL